MATSTPADRVQSASDESPIGCSPFFNWTTIDSKFVISDAINFSTETKCDIFQVQDEKAEWKRNINDDGMIQYLRDSRRGQTRVFRIIFCTFENVSDATFGWQLSMSKTVVLDLLNSFQISLQYLNRLMAPVDFSYMDFASCDTRGKLSRIEFFGQICQFTRDNSKAFWLVYMTHDLDLQSTTYLVACRYMLESNEKAQQRLTHMLRPRFNSAFTSSVSLPDPFIFHLIVLHVYFNVLGVKTERLGSKLEETLSKVHDYSEQSSNQRARDDLERLTIQLYFVSHSMDGVFADVEEAEVIMDRISEAHRRYAKSIPQDERKDGLTKMADVINYLTMGEGLEE